MLIRCLPLLFALSLAAAQAPVEPPRAELEGAARGLGHPALEARLAAAAALGKPSPESRRLLLALACPRADCPYGQRASALLEQLGDRRYKRRQQAGRELAALGVLAWPQLEAGLASGDAEVRQSCRALLATAPPSDRTPRAHRERRLQATLLLAEAGDGSCLAPLEAALADDATPPRVKAAAAFAIRAIRGWGAAPQALGWGTAPGKQLERWRAAGAPARQTVAGDPPQASLELRYPAGLELEVGLRSRAADVFRIEPLAPQPEDEGKRYGQRRRFSADAFYRLRVLGSAPLQLERRFRAHQARLEVTPDGRTATASWRGQRLRLIDPWSASRSRRLTLGAEPLPRDQSLLVASGHLLGMVGLPPGPHPLGRRVTLPPEVALKLARALSPGTAGIYRPRRGWAALTYLGPREGLQRWRLDLRLTATRIERGPDGPIQTGVLEATLQGELRVRRKQAVLDGYQLSGALLETLTYDGYRWVGLGERTLSLHTPGSKK